MNIVYIFLPAGQKNNGSYSPIGNSNEKIHSKYILKLMPLHLNSLRKYYYKKDKGTVPTVTVEVSRDGNSVKRYTNEVPNEGLTNKDKREAAANHLNLDWVKPASSQNQSESICAFSKLYWKKVVQQGRDFHLGFQVKDNIVS